MLKWLVGAIVMAGLGTVAFYILHHPPMRLMPAPLLLQDESGGDPYTRRVLAEENRLGVLFATNRLPIGPSANRTYTIAPDANLHLGYAELRIGEDRPSEEDLRNWTDGSNLADRPYIHLSRMRELGAAEPNKEDSDNEWWSLVRDAVQDSTSKSVTIYVHGANTTVERAAGQASQLLHFSGGNAAVILFVWPTAENFLRYPTDVRNALGSAPKLAMLISELSRRTSAEINLFSYSAGATVAGKALALLANQEPPALARVGEVYFAAPDSDFVEFVRDLNAYSGAVDRITTAVNLGDSALRLAGVVNRGSRTGRPALEELSPEAADILLQETVEKQLEVVSVNPDVLPSTAPSSHTFWYDDPWVSSDIMASLLFRLSPEERGLESNKTKDGKRFWYFPKDYPDLIKRVRSKMERSR